MRDSGSEERGSSKIQRCGGWSEFSV